LDVPQHKYDMREIVSRRQEKKKRILFFLIFLNQEFKPKTREMGKIEGRIGRERRKLGETPGGGESQGRK
jgi:hypothetical protein